MKQSNFGQQPNVLELETDTSYEAWIFAYEHYNNNLTPCAAQLNPVII
ncbi:MAG TPA: hypothetical protein VK021_03520 [Flavobacteriaceae bacterium]|nr:hypothetical protein [Flavobacteriaceae bacterium]